MAFYFQPGTEVFNYDPGTDSFACPACGLFSRRIGSGVLSNRCDNGHQFDTQNLATGEGAYLMQFPYYPSTVTPSQIPLAAHIKGEPAH